jgi:large subunit ribosomal protein L5
VGVSGSADEYCAARASATSRASRRSGFDGRGNYTLGLRDQLLFPEIDYMKVDKARGMNVSVVTTAKTDEEARKAAAVHRMPFRRQS